MCVPLSLSLSLCMMLVASAKLRVDRKREREAALVHTPEFHHRGGETQSFVRVYRARERMGGCAPAGGGFPAETDALARGSGAACVRAWKLTRGFLSLFLLLWVGSEEGLGCMKIRRWLEIYREKYIR